MAVDPEPALVLAPHVRVCGVDDQVILLDLEANRYVGLVGASAAALAERVRNWPALEPSAAHGTASADAVAEILKARGWLLRVGDQPEARNQPEHILPAATRSLDADDLEEAGAHLLSALHAGRSAVAAAWSLRMRTLAAIAQGVAQRKRTISDQCPGASEGKISQAVAAYLRRRPLFFSARDRCLHDSLALVHFLASHRLGANWVIGVRIRPFAAHSWVQEGNLVLNDQHERVRAYRPILVV